MRRLLVSILPLLSTFQIAGSRPASKDEVRFVRVLNDSPIAFGIVSTSGGKSVTDENGVVPGSFFPLETKVGEFFIVKELKDSETNRCHHDQCWKTSFSIGSGEQQEITIDEHFNALLLDDQIYARRVAEDALEQCKEEPTQECILQATTKALQEWDQEWTRLDLGNKRVAALLEDYVCYDPEHTQEQTTSKPIRSEFWESNDQHMHEVHILHDHPSSQIHIIPKFISTQECNAIEKLWI